jgi:anti-sigma factor RsiW
MDDCLNHELISRYVEGDCSGSERRLAEAHLAQCQNCRQQTASARQKKDSLDKSDLYQRGENTVDTGSATESVTDHGQYATESMTQTTTSQHLSPPWSETVQSTI